MYSLTPKSRPTELLEPSLDIDINNNNNNDNNDNDNNKNGKKKGNKKKKKNKEEETYKDVKTTPIMLPIVTKNKTEDETKKEESFERDIISLSTPPKKVYLLFIYLLFIIYLFIIIIYYLSLL